MTFRPHLAYSASAGSGKTFALASRYVALLFMGESPAAILAATFTNKAAAEMRQRVVDSLRGLGEKPADDPFVADVLSQTGLSHTELLARQPRVLRRFLSAPNHIVTLDSFFASILRSSSLEIGLEPSFATREEDVDSIAEHFLEEIYRSGRMADLVQLTLNIEDKRFAKILGLLHHFYTVDPLLPSRPTPTQSTIRSLEEEIESLRQSMFRALTQAKAAQRAIDQFQTDSTQELFAKKFWEKASLSEHSWFTKIVNEEIEALYDDLRSALRRWANLREAHVLEQLFALYDHYRNTRIAEAKSSGILSFDDLTYFTYRLLHESISHDFLTFKIDARFHHILLDEFQDTSTLQFLLLKPLIDEIFAGKGQGDFRTFFYVGDTKQSLYRFRGGVEELFDRVAATYGITIRPMATNYRSSRHVVEQVNQWFEERIPGYTPQRAHGLRTADGREEAGYVHVRELDEEDDPLTLARDTAEQLHAQGISWDDMAFLVHTNKDGQALQQTLLEAQIPTRLKTSSSLRTQPKIAAIVAMVEYLYRGAPIDAEAMMERIGTTLSQAQIDGYTAFMSPLQMIDRLIRDFGYFDDDPNLLKLLEFAAGFDDIPTFLEEFALSSIPVAANTVHGVQIMTIHGSKGLEFDHVILLDRLTRPRPDTAPLMLDYRDDLHIEQIFYRMKGREHIDPAYARVHEHTQHASEKDRLNLLYVALTRAAVGMTILKKPKGSVFDILGMEPLQLGSPAGRGTTGTLFGRLPTPTPVASKLPEPPTLRNYGYQEKPARDDEEERDHEAILFGTALHYALEMLPDFTPAHIDTALEAARNRYGRLLQQHHFEDIRKRITRLLAHEPFTQLLHKATQHREQSLAYRGEFKQIDLLLEYENRCTVIDYKSSRKFASHHETQVRHYMQAIEKILGKPTEGKIVYLLEDRIEITPIPPS